MSSATGPNDFSDRFSTPLFDINDKVTVIGGPFECFDGTVMETDLAQSFATVEINIFGRPTPVSVQFHDLKMQEN